MGAPSGKSQKLRQRNSQRKKNLQQGANSNDGSRQERKLNYLETVKAIWEEETGTKCDEPKCNTNGPRRALSREAEVTGPVIDIENRNVDDTLLLSASGS